MADALRELPSGDVLVPAPDGETAWAECLRDLKRTLDGGSVFLVGRRQRHALPDLAKGQGGDLGREACEGALDELARVLGAELSAQGASGWDSAQPVAADPGCEGIPGCVRPNAPADNAPGEEPQHAEKERLRGLAQRVAMNISVAPGMQAVLAHALPPVLWQPTFAICVGAGQVRVLTLAYVGGPVTGDRPSCKRTPFLLQVVSGDLVPALDGPTSASYAVRGASASKPSTLAHLASLEPSVYRAAESASWAPLHAKELAPLRDTTLEAREAAGRGGRAASVGFQPRPRSGLGLPGPEDAAAPPLSRAPAPGGAAAEAPVSQTVSDRATRMRASLQRGQSPAASWPVAPPSQQQQQQPQPPAEAERRRMGLRARSEVVAPSAPPDAGPPPAAQRKGSVEVSVLADGMSVRGVAGAWNSMAAGGLRGLFARARSPAGLGAAAAAPPPKPPSSAQAAALAQGGPVDRQARMRATLAQAQQRKAPAAPIGVVDRQQRMQASLSQPQLKGPERFVGRAVLAGGPA